VFSAATVSAIVLLQPCCCSCCSVSAVCFFNCVSAIVLLQLCLLQAEDDAERVREAVARTLAMGLMSEDFTLDLNYWLNPTEVRCTTVLRHL